MWRFQGTFFRLAWLVTHVGHGTLSSSVSRLIAVYLVVNMFAKPPIM